MTQATVEVTREKLLQDFNMVVAETEQLLKSAATAGGDKANVWREGVEQNLKAAKDKLVAARRGRGPEDQGGRRGDRHLCPRQAVAGASASPPA